MSRNTISIVTGNLGKVRELQAMALGKLDFVMAHVDIDEIQSLDLHEIVTKKLASAYETIKGPVIVDDVSAELDSLKGLPGPFIKFFNHKLGSDALWQLSGYKEGPITIRCQAAYFDGEQRIVCEGVIQGTVVSPRGTNGFGFDCVVVPDGQDKTMAEVTEEEKMRVSHRGKAFHDLLKQIEQLDTKKSLSK